VSFVTWHQKYQLPLRARTNRKATYVAPSSKEGTFKPQAETEDTGDVALIRGLWEQGIKLDVRVTDMDANTYKDKDKEPHKVLEASSGENKNAEIPTTVHQSMSIQ
jgi:hypothetical protein